MSWKNLASVAVIALLASPALAQPTLHLSNVGLSSSGNWVWELSAEPDDDLFSMSCASCLPANTEGGSLAIEIGLQASLGSILSVTTNPGVIPNAASGAPGRPIVEFENPGNVIFGWEELTDISQAQDMSNMKPVGVQVGTGGDSHQAYIAVGTTFLESAGPHLIATIETTGPSAPAGLTSMLSILGSYDGDSGVVAQSISEDDSLLYDGYVGAASRTVLTGDIDLNGMVNFTDVATLSPNFGTSGKHWGQGDLDGNGMVNFTDVATLSPFFGQSGGSNTPLSVQGMAVGAGAGASAAVPEPTSIALAGLALLAGLGLVRRK